MYSPLNHNSPSKNHQIVGEKRYGLPYYECMQVQRGRVLGGVLSGLFRNIFLPTAKNLGENLLKYGVQKSYCTARRFGRETLRQAVVDGFIPRQGSQKPIPKRTNQLANKRKSAVAKSHQPILRKRLKRRRRPSAGPRDIFPG